MHSIIVERSDENQLMPISNPFLVKGLSWELISFCNDRYISLVSTGLIFDIPNNSMLVAESVNSNFEIVNVFQSDLEIKLLVVCIVAPTENSFITPEFLSNGKPIASIKIIKTEKLSVRFLGKSSDGKIIRFGSVEGVDISKEDKGENE